MASPHETQEVIIEQILLSITEATSSSVTFSDGIRMEILTEERYEDTMEAFMEIWLEDNVLYRHLRIPKKDLREYCELLIQRARTEPITACIAINPSSGGEIAAMSFSQKLIGDPISKEQFNQLPISIQPILAINNEMIQKFVDNPMFDSLKRNVIYGLHYGCKCKYRGRFSTGQTVSQRLASFMSYLWMDRGAIGLVGVSTHSQTVFLYEQMLETHPFHVTFGRTRYDGWKYIGPVSEAAKNASEANGRTIIMESDGGWHPFRGVEKPKYCLGWFSLLPPRAMLKAKKAGKL